MMNSCKNEYVYIFENNFSRPKFLIFDPSASMTLKLIAPKIYLFIFNLENVVETLGESLKPCMI